MTTTENKQPHSPLLHRSVFASPTFIFCTMSFVCIVMLGSCLFHSGSDMISRYFFRDPRDTGMDFFHSIEYLKDRSPYQKFNTLYPPLANLLFCGIYFFMPDELTATWADSFEGSLLLRSTTHDLRTYQAPMLAFIIFLVVSVCIIYQIITLFLNSRMRKGSGITAFFLILSYGMLYSFERGNILFLTVPLILFYIYFRNSENGFLREAALIALAAAAGLKLYPAFFGILLLRDRKFFSAFRAVIYGILSVILPLFAFQEGLSGLFQWLSVVLNFSTKATAAPWNGTGIINILYRLDHYVFYFRSEPHTFPLWIPIVVVALLLLSSFFMKKEWSCILSITMAIVLYQTQGMYIYCLLCIPFTVFLAEEPRINWYNIIPFLLMCGLIVHVPIFFDYAADFRPEYTYRQTLSFLLAVWCCLPILVSLFSSWKTHNSHR